jgi:CRISPR-associated endoribonuclease Cas6
MNSEYPPELSAVVLSLTLESEEPPPADFGRYSHAALLHLVNMLNPLLARRLHGQAAVKPFTISFLHDSLKDGRLLMRVTSLEPVLTSILGHLTGEFVQPIISLGTSHFSVNYAGDSADILPWIGWQTIGELVEQEEASKSATLVFASPTSFSFGRRKIPLPLPELVFGGLLRKWNAFSPAPFPRELQGMFKEQLAISEIRNLNTRMLDFGRYKEKGFTGQVTFEALGSWNQEELRAFNTLADFAFYAGVGYKTTMGMGLTSRVQPRQG